jgi:hypothetical protein
VAIALLFDFAVGSLITSLKLKGNKYMETYQISDMEYNKWSAGWTKNKERR